MAVKFQFSDDKLYFSYFCSKHRLFVLVRTVSINQSGYGFDYKNCSRIRYFTPNEPFSFDFTAVQLKLVLSFLIFTPNRLKKRFVKYSHNLSFILVY